jgi:hypothetical protein
MQVGGILWGRRPPSAGGGPNVPLPIQKPFAETWYKVARRAPKGQGTWVYDPPFTPTLSPLAKGGEGVGSGGM